MCMNCNVAESETTVSQPKDGAFMVWWLVSAAVLYFNVSTLRYMSKGSRKCAFFIYFQKKKRESRGIKSSVLGGPSSHLESSWKVAKRV